MKRYINDFLLAVLAGVSIALGGTVFLSLDNKILGALFFCVGLFTVCTFGFHLFTGKVCYALEQSPAYCGWLVLVWFGNLTGTNLVGYLLRATRLGPALAEKAAALCQVKTSDSLLSIFLLACFCNLLIFLAVDGFRYNHHELGKYLGLFFGVTVFILCGFEHCVANMFYFAVANWWSPHTLLYLLVMTLGNSVGGLLIPLYRLWSRRAAVV